ncbi:tail fiber domain-containing protein [Mastigocoleus sp. MO_188.B34]|uniref:tail fiber domain-containing protein n=1 Tax=Mastigocoleus sp. MO_188.B34 TaxID=3036635 RepID=UPI002624AC9C|nr:tail fiber domain-containing protein [Mastigocoleus sp. MO_188.B34]MDJ0693232.1 tail fiber domain-containing protein [Mastigocoleus sp. MO_188.B34]
MNDEFNQLGRYTFEGPVGIGVNSPSAQLDVSGTRGDIKAKTIFVNDQISAGSFVGDGSGLRNIRLNFGSVNTDQIADNSITNLKIQDGAITKEKLDPSISFNIPNGGVGTQQLADNSVTTPKIANNAVTTLKIQNGAITRDKLDPSIDFDIPNSGVGTAQLADNSVTTPKIANNAVTTLKIQNGAITRDKLDPSIPIGGSTGSQWGNGRNDSIFYSGGNVGIGTDNPGFNLDVQGIINTTQYYKNGVRWQLTRDDIADNAITTNKIQNGAITRDKLNFDPGGGSGGSQWVNGVNNSIYYSQGNVGIGTDEPKAKLQVVGNLALGAENGERWNLAVDEDGNLRFNANGPSGGDLRMIINDDNSNIGIGEVANPQAILHIAAPESSGNFGGEVKFFPTSGPGVDFSYDGGPDGIFGFTNYGREDGDTRFQWQGEDGRFRGLLTITNRGEVRGRLVDISSRALKENITDFSTTEAIEALANLNPVKFNYREDKDKESIVGFIAEDVPELLATHDRKGVCALDIVAVLTKVIKEQQQELSLLKERVNSLETESTNVKE